MQPYKKQPKPYLIGGAFLFVLFFMAGNFLWCFPGYGFYSRVYALFTKDLSQYVSTNWLRVVMTPSLYGVISGLLAFLGCLLAYVRDNDRGVYRNGEEHGSARFATVNEIQRFADKVPEDNIIYTRHARMTLYQHRLEQAYEKNKNAVVVGGPGSGKTYTFIKPNLMQKNASFVVTDPKGLLVHETGKLLKESGYDIKIFNLATLSNSDTFNVFHYIETELDLDRVLESITEGTKKKPTESDADFWPQAEALLIRSFIAYLWFDGKKNDYLPHLGMIADMLRLTERKDKDIPSPVEDWFFELEEAIPGNYACKQWQLFHELFKSETRMSVLAIAAARYSVFDHEQVVDMIRTDTMAIESWNEKKTAVFIAIPETSDTYNFLSAIFISTTMEILRKKADRVLTGELRLPEGKELLHVRYLIDEFANIGRIPNLDKALATFRSRNMSVVMVLQALDQLKTMYPKGWATLVNTCDSFLFLGGDEKETTDYLSKRAGKQTISIRKTGQTKGRQGSSSENRDKMGRDLLTPDEIGRLNGTDALLFISGQYVFKDKKYTVNDHPNAHLLADDYNDANWFTYKRYLTEEEALLDKVRPEDIVDHGTVLDEVA